MSLKNKKIVFEMPIGAFSVFKQTTDEFAQSLRIAAAVKWYEKGIISQGKASEIAGLCREDFLIALNRFDISPFQYTSEEILKEAGYENELGRVLC